MVIPDYDINVFINCPFDEDYAVLFDAIIFTVSDCGFIARSALEVDDSGQVRIDKILDIIAQCRLGIHDISRTELDTQHQLPRFNMPLELGLYLGARHFGDKNQRRKVCLVLDRERYRYQKFIPDIAGQDIKSHGKDARRVIKLVRDWLSILQRDVVLPSGGHVFEKYKLFLADLPGLCERLRLDAKELIYSDYTKLVATWLQAHD